jgi:hypothetical protein
MRVSCGNGQPLPREAAGRNNVISDQAILIDRVVQMAQTKLTSGRSLISHPGSCGSFADGNSPWSLKSCA